MTLGIFTDDFYPFIGGMGRYVYELSRRLPPGRVLVFSPASSRVPHHVRVSPVLHRKLRNLSYSPWLHRNVRAYVERYHLSRVNIQCGPGGVFLLRQLDVPVIATCHHTYWQQSHYISSQFWKRLFVPLERRTYQRADRIICDAVDSRDVLIRKYGIPAAKIVVIPIGIDPQLFHPIERVERIPNSLLFIGRLEKRKGIDFLLRAMPRVVKRIPDAKLYVGGTERKGQGRLQRYARDVHIEGNIEFVGFVPEDELNHWYNRIQVVVVPSVFEGFGLTVVEAMAAGTATIATDVDALRDLVENGVDGYLVGYGDTEALGDAIVSLLGDGYKRALFVEKGMEKVRGTYRWDTIVEAFKEAVELI